MHTSEGLELESETSPAGLGIGDLPNCGGMGKEVRVRKQGWQGPIMASAGYRACTAFFFARGPIQTGEQNVPLPPSRHHNISKESGKQNHRK